MMSYWQQGCNDAKAGKPARKLSGGLWAQQGYDNGYYWGQHGRSRYEATEWWSEHECKPKMENPYMKGISFIETLLEKINDPTNGLDRAKKDEYAVNLLEVRDSLHRFRQQEMEGS